MNTKVQKNNGYWMGLVEVRNDKMMIWKEVTNIRRLTRKDAQDDADLLRAELEDTYNKQLGL